ncbi:Alpha/Beta hydrolase protein [Leucosporidium creatinivorum]|uniref:Alpha/Beta hydrolase protein n=1 Tax=Leucosporidium creatinivorum TaxID=106004 RepID=A0A1Y2DGC0_9BASI|nr:Alpha/Beta hydrolase protein [Leucosporidium creatinivorum]
MPHVSLPGALQLYYELYRGGSSPSTTASPGSSTSPTTTLSLEHPTLVLLSPSWLDVSMLEFSALRSHYNCVLFDLRSHGRTKGEVNPAYDHFVGAADIAFAMEALHVPPSHVYGTGAIAYQVALKLCLLFPNQVLSLSLAGITGLFTEPVRKEAFEELNHAWCFPQDEDDYYEAMDAMAMLFLSGEADRSVDLTDQVIGALVRRYSPYKLRRTFEISVPNHRASGVTKEALAGIKQPILLIHGTEDMAFPLSAIEDVRDNFTGAAEVDWHPIEGAPHMLALTRPDLVLSLFTSFLARHPIFSSTVVPLDLSYALNMSATLARNPKILLRNPRLQESYSILSTEEKDLSAKTIGEWKKLEESCTLWLPGVNEKEEWEKDPKVRPRQPWKFSTRNQNVSRPISARKSLVESITVETQASKWEESALPPIPIPDEALRNLHLNQQRRESDSTPPPPVPPKDFETDSPSCGSTQGLSSATTGGQPNLGTRSH